MFRSFCLLQSDNIIFFGLTASFKILYCSSDIIMFNLFDSSILSFFGFPLSGITCSFGVKSIPIFFPNIIRNGVSGIGIGIIATIANTNVLTTSADCPLIKSLSSLFKSNSLSFAYDFTAWINILTNALVSFISDCALSLTSLSLDITFLKIPSSLLSSTNKSRFLNSIIINTKKTKKVRSSS